MNTIKLLIKLASFFPVQGYVRTANLQREPEACIVQDTFKKGAGVAVYRRGA